MRWWLKLLAIRKIQNKTVMIYHYISTRTDKINTADITESGKYMV